MDIITLLFLAVGLSMDAFAVAICKGLAMPKINVKSCAIVGLWFGGFQGLMPFIGYILGVQFASYIESISSWVAFVLLAFIGGNMIREALSDDEEEADDGLGFRKMLLLAIATSIDALAVGITFACVPVNLSSNISPFINTVLGCFIIAATTCIISMVGVKIGNVFGVRYKKKAEIAGGVILILLGIKILVEYFVG